MKQPSQKENNKVVVLPPPMFVQSPLSNKYDFIVNLRWGDFTREIKVSREQGRFTYDLIKAFNEALLEGSESKPYLLK